MTSPKKVNLALQGGGAHGAFVWGVLDELLEDGRLSIAAISATSAGAMNAVVFAYGMAVGGPKAARSKLEEFWRSVSRMERLFGLAWSPFDRLAQAFGLPPEYHPSHAAIHAATHIVPPNLLNPLNYNPLKDLLLKVIDFKRLNKSPQAVHLFLNATNVRTGKIKVFETPSITVDAVLASACLPPYFQAVEIDGEHYWDGGYLGNPALYPLIYRHGPSDIVIVQVSPITRTELPRTAADVVHRINEISFNSSLMREMRAISFVTDLIDAGKLDNQSYKRINVHWIEAERHMRGLGVSSKLNARLEFLLHLKEIGRLDFHQALISEIGLPALDASSKEPARMTLKISPEWTKNKPRKTPGESIAGRYPIDPRKQKRWMPCNFRLRIDGLEEACKRVSKIEALTIKQKNVELSVGEHRYNLREPASLEIPNLVITLTEHAGQGFYDWHEKFVLEGHNTPEYEKTGTLEYLDSNMKDILFVCHFHHLGILKLTPDKLGAEEIRRMKVEMYCESMEWEFKCAWD